jgi:3-dehydroquinate dehydratase/shikimate dehydrogenase
MICISIYQESRRFALADMLNAARQCDLLEVRLDKFGKAPEVGELLTAKPKPVIFSLRRPQDGGDWDGTEEERLAILRQCIVAGADYVEIELDVAGQVRKFGPTRRVISYTNLQETPAHIGEIYADATTKYPDVIKLVTRADTPEQAWPLVQILAKAPVPTVIVGVGPSGLMLSLLGRMIGAPWTYAALERGMESYPGQPTVEALKSIYRYPEIDKKTRFVGVIGSGERERVVVAMINTALAHLQMHRRCLPIEVGDLKVFRKVCEAVRASHVLVDEEHRLAVRSIVTQWQGAAAHVRAADLIAPQGDKCVGVLILDRAVVSVLTSVLKQQYPGDNPLQGRTCLIAGINPLSKAVAQRIARHGGVLIITDRDRTAAGLLAQELQCRVIQYEALYSTLHDVLVYSGESGPAAARDKGLHAGYLRPGMAVVDLTSPLNLSPLLREAAGRSCLIVPPAQVLLEQTAQHFKLVTDKEPPHDVLRQTLEAMVSPDEEE